MKTTVGKLKNLVGTIIKEARPMRGRKRVGGTGSEWDEVPDDRKRLMCKCGGEHVVKLVDGHVKCKDCGRTWYDLTETRGRISPQEVLTTYEDLYLNSHRNRRKGDNPGATTPGVVTVDELASWIGVEPEALMQVLPKAGLIVDKNGNVVERGMTPASGTLHAVKG